MSTPCTIQEALAFVTRRDYMNETKNILRESCWGHTSANILPPEHLVIVVCCSELPEGLAEQHGCIQ